MVSGAVTNRYTQGLFQYASAHDTIDVIDSSLQVFAQVLRANPELQVILNHPLISADDKVTTVASVLGDAVDPLVLRFLHILLARGRGAYVVAIYDRFHEMAQDAKGELTVEVESAMAMSDEQLGGIEKQLGKVLNKTVSASLTVDPNLIAGCRIHVRDQVIDATIRAALTQFTKKLVSGAVKEGTL